MLLDVQHFGKAFERNWTFGRWPGERRAKTRQSWLLGSVSHEASPEPFRGREADPGAHGSQALLPSGEGALNELLGMLATDEGREELMENNLTWCFTDPFTIRDQVHQIQGRK